MPGMENKKKPDPMDIADYGNRPFSSSDKAILTRYETMAEVIASLFGSGCEIVIHSLEDMAHSVVKTINGNITGRIIGSPITDLALDMLNDSLATKKDVIGPYFSKTRAGNPLKSVKMLIRNDRRMPIGFLCINFDLSMPLSRFFEEFFATTIDSQSAENFAPNVSDLVSKSVSDALEDISLVTGISPTRKNKMVVARLSQYGIFRIRGSIELVAGKLGVSNHAIYKYLREMPAEQ